MFEARARLSPEESRALGRFFVVVARLIVRMGWGWGVLTALAVATAGWAVWTFPTWWGAVRDWLDE